MSHHDHDRHKHHKSKHKKCSCKQKRSNCGCRCRPLCCNAVFTQVAGANCCNTFQNIYTVCRPRPRCCC